MREHLRHWGERRVRTLAMSVWVVCMGYTVSVRAAEPPAQAQPLTVEEVRKKIEERRRAMREFAAEMEETNRVEKPLEDRRPYSRLHTEALLELTGFLEARIPTVETASPRCESRMIQIPRVDHATPQVCIEASVLCEEQNFMGFLAQIIRKPDSQIHGLRLLQQMSTANLYRFDLCKDIRAEGAE